MKWLFLVHQIQTRNSRERVKVWRLIRKVGAVLHRNSVYVLPYDRERLEDMQWICQQIRDSSGEASVFVSEAWDSAEDRLLRELFVANRKEEYTEIGKAARELLVRMKRNRAKQRDGVPVELEREVRRLQERLEEVKRIDFFSKVPPAEIARLFHEIAKELNALRSGVSKPSAVATHRAQDFRGRVWATRENIHVDRLASAWLIRRFIDPGAGFVFVPESELPPDAIHFDVLGAEFSHHGDDCTFETIVKSFRIRDRAVRAIGEIVHDIDLKDHKFARPEASGIDAAIRALSRTTGNDRELLEEGGKLLDGLYENYSGSRKLNKEASRLRKASGREGGKVR